MLTSLLLLLAAQPQADKNVVYATVGDEQLMMDVYRPAPSQSPSAAVVVIHGGGWTGGKREDMGPMAQMLATRGFVAATVSYRLAPKYKWPAMLDDVQTAVRYLRANAGKYNIDPKRIGATGASAGGHLALFLGLRDTRDTKTTLFPKQSSRVSAVFDLFGPTDLSMFPSVFDFAFPVILGKARKEAAAEIKDASPMSFVDKRSAPVFIYQGLADPLVDPKQSRALEAKYKELGLPVEAVYLEGIGHEVRQSDPKCVEAVENGTKFLMKWLKVMTPVSLLVWLRPAPRPAMRPAP